MASLNALSLTKHRRVGIPAFAPKGEPALTHVPLQPPLEVLLLLLLQWDPQAKKTLHFQEAKSEPSSLAPRLFIEPTKQSTQGCLVINSAGNLVPSGESVLIGLSALSFILPYTIGDGSRRPRQQDSSWVFPVGCVHGPTYPQTP